MPGHAEDSSDSSQFPKLGYRGPGCRGKSDHHFVQVKQAMIEELRGGPRLLPAEQRIVDDAAAALEQEAHDLLVSAGDLGF
jgi:hypothetical protein